MDDLGKYAGKSPVHMWTSGAVDMWITVAAHSPCQAPGLSLTPPGDHPAAGMRLSRRPGAARLRRAGQRNGAADGQDRTGRPQMRPIRAVRMSRGPGPQPSRGYCRLGCGRQRPYWVHAVSSGVTTSPPSRCQATRSRVFTTRLTTAPETQRPSPLPGKGPELRKLVAGAGFEPATSGL